MRSARVQAAPVPPETFENRTQQICRMSAEPPPASASSLSLSPYIAIDFERSERECQAENRAQFSSTLLQSGWKLREDRLSVI
jgi:hypothetical protein